MESTVNELVCAGRTILCPGDQKSTSGRRAYVASWYMTPVESDRHGSLLSDYWGHMKLIGQLLIGWLLTDWCTTYS